MKTTELLCALLLACVPRFNTRQAAIDCSVHSDCDSGICSALGRCEASADNIAPHLVSIDVTQSDTLVVTFDEEMWSDDLADPTRFSIDPPLEVLATTSDAQRVTLTTAPQSAGTTYLLTTTVRDLQGNMADPNRLSFVGFGMGVDTR